MTKSGVLVWLGCLAGWTLLRRAHLVGHCDSDPDHSSRSDELAWANRARDLRALRPRVHARHDGDCAQLLGRGTALPDVPTVSLTGLHSSMAGAAGSVPPANPAFISRAARTAFWGGVPIAVVAILLRPRGSVLYVGRHTFSLELNPVVSRLPSFLAELWFFYPATLFAVAVLGAVVLNLRLHRSRRRRSSVSLLAVFLPTYIAGIESTQLFSWSLRCHSLSSPPSLSSVILKGVSLSAIALLFTVVAGVAAARSCGRRSRVGMPVPPVVGAIVASVTLLWWFVWTAFVAP